MMKNRYYWDTRIGPFYIAASGGRFEVLYQDEPLGSYPTPEMAAADLAGGHTFSIAAGIDTATLGIPEDLKEWSRLS
jgi:hypothetical protein